MSGSATSSLESAILGHTLGYAPMPAPVQVFVALCMASATPTDDLPGVEVSGGGYTRMAALFGADAIPSLSTNTQAIEFPVATSDWGAAGYFEIWDALTGGNRLYWGPLVDPADGTTPVTEAIVAGDIMRFSPGALGIQILDLSPLNGPWLPLAGGSLYGPLTLNADPTVALGAATKNYVDMLTAVGLPPGGPFLPLAGGALSGGLTLSAGGSFTGTIAGSHTYSGALTFSQSGGFPLSVPSGSVVFGSGATGGFLRLQGQAGTNRTTQFTTNNLARWSFVGTNAAESTYSVGTNFEIQAYLDSGAFSGNLLQGQRTSGGMGGGQPQISSLASWTQAFPRAVIPGGVTGNYQNYLATGDIQPTYTLGANPLSVTSGSPTVTVTWVGSSGPNGPLSRMPTYQVQVRLAGATAVGGITPAGWLNIQAVIDADHFTVTWTSNATSTATGGGAAVTLQPSFCTLGNVVQSTTTWGGDGFNLQTEELWQVNPYLLQSFPKYLQRWHWTVGPNDTSGTNAWSLAGMEWDLTNRGRDMGYHPNAGDAVNNTTGIYIGPKSGLPSWVTGGGVGANWNSVFNVYAESSAPVAQVYDAYLVQPNALVGASRDPSGHGGVGVDIFGSYVQLPGAPFATTSGTSTVTVSTGVGVTAGHVAGDQVWFPNVITLNGVTFGGASYPIASVIDGQHFTITGTGTASSTGSGGTGTQWIAFANYVPYAPYQAWGSFKHGLISTNARFESGGIVETQPGNGVLWNDGTGTASINGTAGTVGNIGVTLTTAGTGVLNIAGHAATTATTPASFSANRYLAIQINGTTFYLPLSTIAW